MKSFSKLVLFLSLAGSLVFAFGCASTHKQTVIPTVELTGTSNAPVTGYYILKGKRVELTGVLPLTNSQPGLSQLAVRKVNSEETLVLTARTASGTVNQCVPANLDEGIRVTLDDLKLYSIPPQETLAPIEGTRIVLAPYWAEDQWVFDDPVHGFSQEPFVKGMPEMLKVLVKDIPDAQTGFRLIVSTKPFKGFQKKLLWVRAEAGGNYYRFADKTKKKEKPLEGWFCPGMYRYFPEMPKELYVKASSKMS